LVQSDKYNKNTKVFS